jgi:hypothetical protein
MNAQEEQPMAQAKQIKYHTVYKQIHPPEADRIADAYHQARMAVDQGRLNLTMTLRLMDADWEGLQKIVFMEHARAEEKKIGQFGEYLGNLESKYRNIKVTIEVQEPITPV